MVAKMNEYEKLELSRLVQIYANLEVQKKMLPNAECETQEWCALAKQDILDFVCKLVNKSNNIN